MTRYVVGIERDCDVPRPEAVDVPSFENEFGCGDVFGNHAGISIIGSPQTRPTTICGVVEIRTGFSELDLKARFSQVKTVMVHPDDDGGAEYASPYYGLYYPF